LFFAQGLPATEGLVLFGCFQAAIWTFQRFGIEEEGG